LALANGYLVVTKIPLIGGFVEKQHQIKFQCGAEKRLRAMLALRTASKTARVMLYEDAS
jgi:hypothetical protein